ncbi:glucose-6-phosphate isomerase [Haladaptatus sp. F3-133]|uniref:Probable glucose-6-phosphate isomerase n=1 Tax=Halorutilus salinus TaxID=2487751 RepID=A0A9Q4GK77_9EURY|nr:glucose-6-phosphate isomerase [Halorutilus salinus]
MNVDLSNVLEERVDGGLTRDKVAESGADEVDVPENVARLPERTDAGEIAEAGARLAERFDAFVNIGIGGSSLGGATVVDALAPDAPVYFVDNVDPDALARLLDSVPLRDTVFSVVSKSGRTAETVANYAVVRDALREAGVEPSENTVVTTGEASPLRDADTRATFTFADVPGRYSALSTVGLLPAAFAGVDVESVVRGGEDGAVERDAGVLDDAGRALGATNHLLGEGGVRASVMMPYAERLETFADWYVQIWAESLGKDGTGQTPVRAVGATDQHSLLQLLVDGPGDKLVTFVDPGGSEDGFVVEDEGYLNGVSLDELRSAELDATRASLVRDDVPNVRVELDGVTPEEVGELLYTYEIATVVAGRLAGVNPFDQPGVEWGKRAARGALGDDSCAEEREVVGSVKETLLRV